MDETPVVFRRSEWKGEGSSRIPFWAYTDDDIYRQELERFFYSGHWCYVALEAEIPNPGDFKRTVIGERSVIVTRAADGEVYAVENVCAHRGVRFCREKFGNRKDFTCPYHQWNYDLKGNLVGVPFRRGVKLDGKVHGGMPSDFDPKEHGLTKLKVATRNGVVFASFDHDVPSLEEYLGPTILRYFDRVFDGRKLTILGYSRQRIPGNWKLMQENIKDPYHASLLHVFFVTFGLFRADQKSATEIDPTGRHGILISRSGKQEVNDVTSGMRTFRNDIRLADPRIMDVVKEFPGEDTVAMITVFPSVVLQQNINSLSIRHIVPTGPDGFDFHWTHWCYADDTPEMRLRRMRQANLFGPAGFVSADDGEIIEMSQQGFSHSPDEEALVIMGGREIDSVEHMVTEVGIRGMYRYWRSAMGL
jgi:salicylate 5-hydroxylase large subunit